MEYKYNYKHYMDKYYATPNNKLCFISDDGIKFYGSRYSLLNISNYNCLIDLGKNILASNKIIFKKNVRPNAYFQIDIDIQHWLKNNYLLNLPIENYSVPKFSINEIKKAYEQIKKTKEIEKVCITCYGGRGRTGLLLAVLYMLSCKDFIHFHTPQEFIGFFRKKYDPHAIETSEQERYIKNIFYYLKKKNG